MSTRLLSLVAVLCLGGIVIAYFLLYNASLNLCTGNAATVVAPLAIRSINTDLPHLASMPRNITHCLDRISRARWNSRATFVQVGANDGLLNDPLYEYMNAHGKEKWIGILAEPQPELFGRLVALHAADVAKDWSFYPGALAPPGYCSSTNGTISFCETTTPGVGDWHTQGQLNTITVETCSDKDDRHGPMVLKMRPCESSFENLVQKHASQAFRRYAFDHFEDDDATARRSDAKKKVVIHLDLLQIDVEGHDYDLLSMIDWNFMKPTCIHYEHEHLHGETQTNAESLLAGQGYTLLRIETDAGMDTLACLVTTTAPPPQPSKRLR